MITFTPFTILIFCGMSVVVGFFLGAFYLIWSEKKDEDKRYDCWHKIEKVLISYNYSYMDMLKFLHLMDVSRVKRELNDYIKEIIKRK